LLTFVASIDVSNVLSNRKRLSAHNGIAIKPQLTLQEREVGSFLLKERRSLLSTGIPSYQIRLSTSTLKVTLNVNNGVHGKVINRSFIPNEDIVEIQAHSPTLPPEHYHVHADIIMDTASSPTAPSPAKTVPTSSNAQPTPTIHQ
jgi:hypothetical protein